MHGRGAREELLLAHPDTHRIDDGRDRAWVVVARHPYYTATDSNGGFRLDEVPPGRYTLVVWHPPVNMAGGTAIEPKPVRRQVTVRAGAATQLSLKLE